MLILVNYGGVTGVVRGARGAEPPVRFREFQRGVRGPVRLDNPEKLEGGGQGLGKVYNGTRPP